MRKTRSDCVLLNLPEEQQARVADWLLSQTPLWKCRELLQKELGVELRSLSSFKPFWEQVCTPILLERQKRLAKTSVQLADDVERSAGKFDAASKSALEQKAFEMLTSPTASAEEIAFIVGLALKAKDQAIKEQQLALTREKFEFNAAKVAMEEAAKIKSIAADGKLDSNAKIASVRQLLFGIQAGTGGAK